MTTYTLVFSEGPAAGQSQTVDGGEMPPAAGGTVVMLGATYELVKITSRKLVGRKLSDIWSTRLVPDTPATS